MADKVKFSKTRAHQRYTLADGRPVPGVTTVLGILNKPALMHWAWEQGMAGEDYRKTRDAAADAGTLAHWLIECHLTRRKPDLSEFSPAVVDQAENAALKFISWWDKSGLAFAMSEAQLVSELHGYGGTIDVLARRGSDTVLIDIKTSKAIYPEMWRQVAAYGLLLPRQPDAYIIARIGKDDKDADWEVQERRDLSRQAATFLAVLGAYKALKAEG